MAGKSPGPFPNCDWRFNEFPNPAAHALHVTCVELMALPVPGKDVGNALLNVVLKRSEFMPVRAVSGDAQTNSFMCVLQSAAGSPGEHHSVDERYRTGHHGPACTHTVFIHLFTLSRSSVNTSATLFNR